MVSAIPVYINNICPNQWYAETTKYGLYIFHDTKSFMLCLMDENKSINDTLDFLVSNRQVFEAIDEQLYDWMVDVACISPIDGSFLKFPVDKYSFYIDDLGVDVEANARTGEVKVTIACMLLCSYITELVSSNEEISWIQGGRLITSLMDEFIRLGGPDKIIQPRFRDDAVSLPTEVSSFSQIHIDELTYNYNMQMDKDRIWLILPQRVFDGSVGVLGYKYSELKYFKQGKLYEKLDETFFKSGLRLI